MLRVGGIVLCGGQSRRMGRPKAMLPFGSERMLQRVVRLLGQIVQPLVVVAAEGQDLPPLPGGVTIARDRAPARGPLEGLRAGLTAIAGDCDAAYATACDVPLLQAPFVQLLICKLARHQVAVPIDGEFYHPLAAVYRTEVLAQVESLLAQDRLRPAFLYDAVATCRVPVDELRRVDPQLHTLANLNRPEDYLAALRSAGLPPPTDLQEFSP